MVMDLGVTLFGCLTPVHRHTDRQTDRYLHCTVSLTWVVRGLGVTLLEASHLYTDRQTDRQVLTLYCEFDLGGEGFGSHPVGSLTPVHSLVVVWSDGEDEFILRFAEATLVGEVDLLIVLVPEAKIGDPC